MSKEEKNTSPWKLEQWALNEELSDSSSLPKITIGILSFNRINDLRRTLDCIVRSVQYPDYEVIVVDNASKDGSVDMICREFPEVKVIALETNIATAARNFFYKQAIGKYVFSYDDDSFPATPSTIYKAVCFLERHPDCDALSFFCFQPLANYSETGGLEKFRFSGNAIEGFKGLFFVEGGMCIRSPSFAKTQGYDPEFMWGSEGFELTLQMYNLGMQTVYYPALATLHMKSGTNRNITSNIHLVIRNQIWTIFKHFPLYAAIPLIFLFFIRKIITLIFHWQFAESIVTGVIEGISGIPKQRKKTSKLNLKQVLKLQRWYLGFLRW